MEATYTYRRRVSRKAAASKRVCDDDMPTEIRDAESLLWLQFMATRAHSPCRVSRVADQSRKVQDCREVCQVWFFEPDPGSLLEQVGRLFDREESDIDAQEVKITVTLDNHDTQS